MVKKRCVFIFKSFRGISVKVLRFFLIVSLHLCTAANQKEIDYGIEIRCA